MGYWSLVDSLWWNVESTLKLDYEGASTPMGSNGPTMSSYTLLAWAMRVGLALGSLLCIKTFW